MRPEGAAMKLAPEYTSYWRADSIGRPNIYGGELIMRGLAVRNGKVCVDIANAKETAESPQLIATG